MAQMSIAWIHIVMSEYLWGFILGVIACELSNWIAKKTVKLIFKKPSKMLRNPGGDQKTFTQVNDNL
jgi:hypothetical protein